MKTGGIKISDANHLLISAITVGSDAAIFRFGTRHANGFPDSTIRIYFEL
jgi:hypothetical protein